MRQAFELPVTRLNLFVIQDAQSVKTKGFYGKRRHHAPEDNRLLHRFGRSVACRRQIAEEPARKRVARSSGITNILQRKRRCAEDLLFREHEDAVFASLDDEMLRAPGEDQFG